MVVTTVAAHSEVVMPLLANAVAKLSARAKFPSQEFGTTSNVNVLLKDCKKSGQCWDDSGVQQTV